MKTITRIQKMRDSVDVEKNKFTSMSYEQGIWDALTWVLDEMDEEEDKDFEDQI